MSKLEPEVWNLALKIVLNDSNYYCWISYTTLWPRELRLLSDNCLDFIGPWVRIQGEDQKMHLIFFSTDFYTFFLCICVCNTKGDAHKPCGPPKREGKPILPRVWKDLAHCAGMCRCVWVCASIHKHALACRGVGRSGWVSVSVCVCGTNFQNIF